MLGSAPPSSQMETSALSSHRAPPSFNNESAVAANSQPSNNTRDGRPWSAKCKKPNHTLDTHMRIHGKLENWRPSCERRANVANDEPSTSDPQPFRKEILDVLHKLFGQTTPSATLSVIGAGSVAYQGTFSTALLSQNILSNSWIVDSGASEHMTGNLKLLHSYSPC